MLFRSAFHEGLRNGAITLAFRRWRPSVRAGGTLLTPVGQLEIASVDPVALETISAADARQAGYPSLADLLAELRRGHQGEVYRIALGPLRPDPRLALRQDTTFTSEEGEAVRTRLDRFDARAPGGPWTLRTLAVLQSNPGVRAGDLCGPLGLDKEHLKRRVRQLKALGLTESLGTGYRLSPRGEALLRALRAAGSDAESPSVTGPENLP